MWRDDFNGTQIDKTKWAVYNGNNGGSPRSSANTFVSGGLLTLRTSQINGVWTSAGVTNARSFSQTYGKFVIRARVDGAVGTRATALLWPAGGGWPPEVDFLEIGGADSTRKTNLTANHYGSSNSMQHVAVASDYRDWHTIGVEWTPTSLVYTLDGVVTGMVLGHVPQQSMWLGLQSRIGFAQEAQPNSTTPANVDYQIDWVQIYRMA